MNPSVVDNVLYFGDIAGFFYALDTHSGTLLWKRSLKIQRFLHVLSQIAVSPAVGKKVVYVGTKSSSIRIKSQKRGNSNGEEQVFNPKPR